MKKFVILGSLIILFVIIVIGGYLWFSLDNIIKHSIEKYGSAALTTKVRVGSVSIKLTKGAGSIRHLRVSNPTGFSNSPIFSFDNIHLKLDIPSITQKIMVIDKVTINSPAIAFEVNRQGKTNVLVLQQNIKANQAKPVKKTTATSPTKTNNDDKSKRFIIKRLTISSAKVDARIAMLKKHYTVTLPTIVLTNLGAPQGATPKALASQIGIALSQRVLSAMGQSYGQRYLNARIGEVQKKIDDKLTHFLRKNI